MINFQNTTFSPRLLQKITAAQSEDDAYAADELVELGEEILSQLAAMGIAAYLKQPKQKEVFNDFLMSCFYPMDTAKMPGHCIVGRQI